MAKKKKNKVSMKTVQNWANTQGMDWTAPPVETPEEESYYEDPGQYYDAPVYEAAYQEPAFSYDPAYVDYLLRRSGYNTGPVGTDAALADWLWTQGIGAQGDLSAFDQNAFTHLENWSTGFADVGGNPMTGRIGQKTLADQYADLQKAMLAARPKLAESPEWLAFQQALGLEQNTFQADIDRQRALIQQDAARRQGIYQSDANRMIGDLGARGELQRTGIDNNHEARGVYRSGARLDRRSEQQAEEGRQKAGIQAGLSNQMSDLQSGLTNQMSNLESSLAQRLIDINARKAQQEFELRQKGYV